MRPDHPLPDPLPLSGGLGKGETVKNIRGKPRKRLKDPPVRARKRTIDPTKWGTEHLKGAFLNSVVADDAMDSSAGGQVHLTSDVRMEVSSEEDSDDSETREVSELETMKVLSKDDPTLHSEPPFPPRVAGQFSQNLIQFGEQDDFEREKQRSLGLLQTLFGNQDDNWGGQESVESDVEIYDQTQHASSPVPIDTPFTEEGEKGFEDAIIDLDNQDTPNDTVTVVGEESARLPAIMPTQATKLKDLFAPREENGMRCLHG